MISFFRLTLACAALCPFAAHGTIVTTAMDEDDGSLGGGTGVSLREAVKYATSGDTVTFAPALSGQTIRLTGGRITILTRLTIDSSALPGRVIISGDKTGNGRTGDDTGLLQVSSTVSPVHLNYLTLEGGYSSSGAGVLINSANPNVEVNISDCIITGNYAFQSGGGISCGINSLTIQNSILSNNSATSYGGAIITSGNLTVQNTSISGSFTTADGGAVYIASGNTLIENSTFSSNSTNASGGGIAYYGRFGGLTVNNSTFAVNSASMGAGIYNEFQPATLSNCTFTANAAGAWGGGVYNYNSTLKLYQCTLTGNSAGFSSGGGGIFASSTSLLIQNSIVAGNSSNVMPPYPPTGNNLTSGTPRLAPLGNYGGFTQTMPPLPGSPAINAGGTTTLTTDQRGFARISNPDIGAAEYQKNADLSRFWNLDFDGDGLPYGVEQALGTDPLVSDPANSRNLVFPAFNAAGHAILSLGLSSTPAQGTVWLLERSTDLSTESFSEIYRFDGSDDTMAPGVEISRTATGVTVTDTSPPLGGAFYRFAASFEP